MNQKDSASEKVICPLCKTSQPTLFFEKPTGEVYFECNHCKLVFLSPRFYLSREEECKRYSLHQNKLDDPRYRAFLQPIADLALAKVSSAANNLNGIEALDYGCGPGPLLAKMLLEKGVLSQIYDPLFFPDPDTLNGRYNLITASEVIEHFRNPAAEFAKLSALLKPSGWLIVMTETLDQVQDFSRWHYHRDPTHIVFYRQATFEYIRSQFEFCDLETPSPRLAAFRKP